MFVECLLEAKHCARGGWWETQINFLNSRGRGKMWKKINVIGTVVLKYLPVSFPSGSSALLCLCVSPPVTHSLFSLKAQSFRKEIQVLLGTNKLKCREGEVPRRQRREADPLCSLSGASMEGVWNWERRWEAEREEKRRREMSCPACHMQGLRAAFKSPRCQLEGSTESQDLNCTGLSFTV